MRFLRLILLSVLMFSGVCAHAEQRVLIVTGSSGGYKDTIDLDHMSPVTALLKQGWRVVSMSTTSSCSGSYSARQYLIVFVLESPAQEVKP